MSTYYKIIGNNFGSFPYKLGLNRLADNNEIFNPSPECGPGGLYFCNIEHIFEWFEYGDTVCELSIPTGAQVVAVGDKFKADSIYIEQKMDLHNVETFKYLISKGATINSGLICAIKLDCLDIVVFLMVKYLVENGADIHANNDYALECASENDHLSVVKYLVENGEDSKIHTTDED